MKEAKTRDRLYFITEKLYRLGNKKNRKGRIFHEFSDIGAVKTGRTGIEIIYKIKDDD